MKTEQPSERWWLNLPWTQLALAGGYLSFMAKDPEIHQGMMTLARSAVLAAGAGGLTWWALNREHPERSDEDEFAHFGVVGLSRSGKTAWAILKLLDWQRRGWGWCWLSIKGGGGVLPYLPPSAVDSVDLISPASLRPRGINMLRLVANTPQEREQVADQTAEILHRLHPATSDLMYEMVRMGTLALLEYSSAITQEVSILDLYRFFETEPFRRKVLRHVRTPPIHEAFRDDTGTQRTLEAVQRQMRRFVSSRALLLTLGRSGQAQVDIRAAMAAGRGIVVDASDAELGPVQAALVNEVVASKVQLFTAQRDRTEPGFGVIADEVQEYQGAGNAFRRALALAAEYRVAWVLVNQFRDGQLNSAMQAAVNLAGSHVFFRLASGDAAQAVKTLSHRATAETLVQLEKRQFYMAERRRGRVTVRVGSTPDLPPATPEVALAIRQANERGPTAEAILTSAYRRMGEGVGRRLWD